ncbi:hypothetical protein ACFV5N_12480 [Streptomyces sp. NPDC059853]|uniref:hypothetical protein n=1 Tax=Streptomyces sp. NPDC059853 TaxID=3346973 RepID=UPI003666DC3F
MNNRTPRRIRTTRAAALLTNATMLGATGAASADTNLDLVMTPEQTRVHCSTSTDTGIGAPTTVC